MIPEFAKDARLYRNPYPRGTVSFEVQNGRTNVFGVPESLAKVIDRECRYPTALAAAYDGGFVSPDSNHEGWDGWVRLFHQPKTIPAWFPTGLLGRCLSVTSKMGYDVNVIDRRVRPVEDVPEFVDLKLRDYQQEAVRRALAAGRGVLDMPPRSGKTRTMAEIVRQLALPTIWIAPTSRIVEQTVEVLQGYLGSGYVTGLVGAANQMIASRFKIVVCTYATAAALSPEFYKTREIIAIDEFHHGASAQHRDVLDKCEHIYFRYGMTGTFFRSGVDELAMHALLSNVIYKVTSLELIQRGYLTPTRVVFLPVLGPRLRGVGSDFQTGHGKHGIQEHELRNRMVSNAVAHLYRAGKRVLVLVGTKVQGETLKALIQPSVEPTPRGAEFESVEFCSTNMPRPKIERAIKSFLETNEVKILIGTSLLGEGVDLPSVDALVYARGEQAEVTLVQNAYRVATAVPGKREALIVEFADRHHRKLLEHSQERLRVYCGDPLFRPEILQDPNMFPAWLASNFAK